MERTLNIRGCRYFVTTQGNGRPLLLLHGFTGSSQNWQAITPALSSRYRVAAVDLLGHGRTDSPPDPARYQMAEAASDLIAILDELGAAQVDLLGYSMGGRLALYTTVHHPRRINRLILESASPGLKTEQERRERRQRDNALADRIEREGIEAFVNFWEGLPLWDSQKGLAAAARQNLRKQRLQNNPVGLANSLRGMGTGIQPSLWEQLGNLKMPVHLIAGALDDKFAEINRQMVRQIPTARLEIAPDAGHTVHLERPLLFQGKVLEFLAKPCPQLAK
ncbi:MAG TPA: 2-succinyl-6-hydroxy-2,4-cyclohexadiene-1-carboxylate synthase [Anaerolineae bacterium]|nr:2-succinyl-6-hydroxy-2,4-cyclohexadiene-1-carboxylate synthase [Anaerolineae bacterium]